MAKRKGLYKPKFRDKKGRLRESSVFWCSYKSGDQIIRESTGYRTQLEAQIFLDQRRGLAADSKPIRPKADKILIDELLQDKVNEYELNDRDTTSKLERVIRLRFLPFFGGRRAHSILESDLTNYKVWMKKKEISTGRFYKPNTIDGDLRLLKSVFMLGMKHRKITHMPDFEFLNQDIPRTGFFTDEELQGFCEALPEDIAAAVWFAAETAWRTPSETLTREWNRHVDMDREVVWLDGGEGKNAAAKIFPFTRRLREIFKHQLEINNERKIKCNFVFHHNGEPLFHRMKKSREVKPSDYFRNAWRAACIEKGFTRKDKKERIVVTRTPHDLCRTGIRNFDRKGLSQREGQALSGRKTPSIYDRYNVILEDRLKEAVAKLDGELPAQNQPVHFKVTSK